MPVIKLDTSVNSAAEVDRTVVLETCDQVRRHAGEAEALDVAAGALSAAVAVIATGLGEDSARRVLDTAFSSGLEAMRSHAASSSELH